MIYSPLSVYRDQLRAQQSSIGNEYGKPFYLFYYVGMGDLDLKHGPVISSQIYFTEICLDSCTEI